MPEPPAPPPAPDLAAIAARATAATEGPWHVEPGSNFVYPAGTPESEQFFLLVDQYGDWLDFDGYWRGRADAAFIAAARTDVPALVAYARALEAENARLRARDAAYRLIIERLTADDPGWLFALAGDADFAAARQTVLDPLP